MPYQKAGQKNAKRIHDLKLTFITVFLFSTCNSALAAFDNDVSDLASLSLEDLTNVKVSSVSKKAEPLSAAPAAIYVITQEDIRRSGYRYLPEMLRLAPNLQVGLANASSYAITARGFNSDIANKLLVLIDGRSVYTPLYSGVFWNAQDVLPEDIDRIEVISGPGGTLWGANAVNGVINVVTKSSRATQGGSVHIGGGTAEKDASAQYGGKLGDDLTYRFYAKGFSRYPTVKPAGTTLKDSWNSTQGGFRIDWTRSEDSITLQGDMYEGDVDQPTGGKRDISGHNILARWNRQWSSDSALQVQAYYDTHSQFVVGSTGDTVTTYDLEAQYSFKPTDAQSAVIGGGYRYVTDRFRNAPPGAAVLPDSSRLDLSNIFVEDGIALTDALKLTLGVKLEHNEFTGFEYLPSGRLAWTTENYGTLWGAISRAVRTPSRFDRDIYQLPLLAGGPAFTSEQLVAYEVGYRVAPTPRTSLSISTFYNVYDDLRTLELSPTGTFPVTFRNGMEGNTYGVEIWGTYAITDWWRINAGYNALQEDLKLKPGSRDIGTIAAAGNDPHYQFSAGSSMNLPYDIEWDFRFRGIGRLPSPRLPSYIALDMRLGWHMTDQIELSVTGANLTDDRHRETTLSSTREFRRSVYAGVEWKF